MLTKEQKESYLKSLRQQTQKTREKYIETRNSNRVREIKKEY